MFQEISLKDILTIMFDARVAKLWMDVAMAHDAQKHMVEIESDLEFAKNARIKMDREIAKHVAANTKDKILPGKNSWYEYVARQEFMRQNMHNVCATGFVALQQLLKTPDLAKKYDMVINLNSLVNEYNRLAYLYNDKPHVCKQDTVTKIQGLQNKIATVQLNALIEKRDALMSAKVASKQLQDVQAQILKLQQGTFAHQY